MTQIAFSAWRDRLVEFVKGEVVRIIRPQLEHADAWREIGYRRE